jgi:hypothetical protein
VITPSATRHEPRIDRIRDLPLLARHPLARLTFGGGGRDVPATVRQGSFGLEADFTYHAPRAFSVRGAVREPRPAIQRVRTRRQEMS